MRRFYANSERVSLHFIFDMGRFKQTARKSTPPLIPVLTPTVYLNPDGTVKRDPKQDRMTAIRSKMAKAIEMMDEIKIMILDLDSSENSDVQEIEQPKKV